MTGTDRFLITHHWNMQQYMSSTHVLCITIPTDSHAHYGSSSTSNYYTEQHSTGPAHACLPAECLRVAILLTQRIQRNATIDVLIHQGNIHGGGPLKRSGILLLTVALSNRKGPE